MYKILANDTLIYDSTLEDYKINKGDISLELNKSGSFSFSMYPDHFYYYQFVKMKTVLKIYKDGDIIFRGRILNDASDYWNNNNFICEGELGFLRDSIIRPHDMTGTPLEVFSYYINQHNSQVDDFKKFKIGKVTVSAASVTVTNTAYQKTFENITNQLIGGTVGGYIHITHEDGEDIPTIHWLSKFEHTAAQKIEFGKNLKNYTKKVSADNIATAIIPLGGEVETTNSDGETEKTTVTIESVNNGVNYVYDAEAIEKYGWIFSTVEYKEIIDAAALKKAAEKDVKSSAFLNITIELTAIDLHLLDRSIESYKLGDNIPIVTEPHNFNDVLLCSKQTINLLRPENDTITLGHTYSTFTETTSKVSATFNDITNIQNTINRVSSKMGSISIDTDKIAQDYNNINTELSTVKGDNEALAAAITTNAQNITLNAQNISANAAAIEGILARLEAIENGG